MKKISLILTIVLLFCLVGCKNEEKNELVKVELLNNSSVFKTIYVNDKDIGYNYHEHELVIYNDWKIVYKFKGYYLISYAECKGENNEN